MSVIRSALGAIEELRGLTKKGAKPADVLGSLGRLADHALTLRPTNGVSRRVSSWSSPEAANADLQSWRGECVNRGDEAGTLLADSLMAVLGYFVLVAPVTLIPTDAQIAEIGAGAVLVGDVGIGGSPQASVLLFGRRWFKFQDDQQRVREDYDQRLSIAGAALPLLRTIFLAVMSGWGA